jgi:hypothetical protein
MRILEQQNDDFDNDNGDSAKSGAGDKVNTSMEMEPPQAPATAGEAHGCAQVGDHEGGGGPVHGGEPAPAAAPCRRQQTNRQRIIRTSENEESCFTKQPWLRQAFPCWVAQQQYHNSYLKFFATPVLYHPKQT